MRPLRLGTRGSRLALAQSATVAALLRARSVDVEVVTIVTAGDTRAADAPIGEGVFVKAIEAALVSGEIDVAVHSAKDVPLESDASLTTAAFPERADPRDALVTRSGATSLDALPSGAVVGTDSPRRAGFLRALRADLRVVPLHGNVDTRLRRLDDGACDALLLACAGLDRLGFSARIGARIDPSVIPPAPGQGALAVQARRADATTLAALRALDDAAIRRAVVAERAVLRAIGGGCRAPVGVLATARDGGFDVLAGTATPGGSAREVVSAFAAATPRGLAGAALECARALMAAIPQPARALLDVRPEVDAAFDDALRTRGFRVVHAPTFRTEPAGDEGALARARAALGSYDWVVLTSKRGVAALLDGNAAPAAAVRWAAAGPATAQAIRAHQLTVSAVPDDAGARGIPDAMAELGPLHGARVLLARADAADPWLPQALERRGAVVDDVVAYRTVEGPPQLEPALRAALGDPDLAAVVFASGSAVRGLVALAGPEADRARGLAAFTIGPQTSAVAREHGFTVAAEAKASGAVALAATIAGWYETEVTRWVEAQLQNS
jgi:hydroxymethylbilane synthase